ncbi:MAG: hypothetical protein QOI89_2724 [Solirubrobacteraceae bacterium]|jgi:hypothetical protein|nr:hypothetical protein [Solirubrobacteraceae bacterium]
MTDAKPIDELVAALLDSTRSGKAQWEQVDAQGRTFLAARPSGSVLLSGGGPEFLGTPSVKLEVKNAEGVTIETAESSGALIELGGSVSGLGDLYTLVTERHSRTGETLRSLAKEFSG